MQRHKQREGKPMKTNPYRKLTFFALAGFMTLSSAACQKPAPVPKKQTAQQATQNIDALLTALKKKTNRPWEKKPIVKTLAKMGPDAQKAIPTMESMLINSAFTLGLGQELATARGQMGPKGIQALRRAFHKAPDIARGPITDALVRLGQKGDGIIPVLHTLLKRPGIPPLYQTARLIDAVSKRGWKQFVAPLKGTHQTLRTNIVQTLRYTHKRRHMVLSILTTLLRHKSPDSRNERRLRAYAMITLAHFGLSGTKSTLQALQNKDPLLRRGAAEALAYHDKHPLIVARALQQAAKDKDAKVREYAIWSISYMRKASHIVRPTLKQAKQDPNQSVRQTAEKALHSFQKQQSTPPGMKEK
jgi:hypothetical protein